MLTIISFLDGFQQSLNETLSELSNYANYSATQTFLNELKAWFYNINVDIPFREFFFIFNTSIETNMSQTDLIITLEIKYYIFSTKRLNGTLSITAFKNRLRYTILALKEIAIKNEKIDSFERQWQHFLP